MVQFSKPAISMFPKLVESVIQTIEFLLDERESFPMCIHDCLYFRNSFSVVHTLRAYKC